MAEGDEGSADCRLVARLCGVLEAVADGAPLAETSAACRAAIADHVVELERAEAAGEAAAAAAAASPAASARSNSTTWSAIAARQAADGAPLAETSATASKTPHSRATRRQSAEASSAMWLDSLLWAPKWLST